MIKRMILEYGDHVVGLARFIPFDNDKQYRGIQRMAFQEVSDLYHWHRSKRRFERRSGRGQRRCFVMSRASEPIVVIRYFDGDGCSDLEGLFRVYDVQFIGVNEFAVRMAQFRIAAHALKASEVKW